MSGPAEKESLAPPGSIGLACFLVILVIGAALRFHSLGGPGLWVDEAYTVGITRGSLSELFGQLRADDAPPLYYLLQAGFLRVLGSSEFAARFLSVLASLSTLALLHLWARRFGPVAACFVPIVWATSTLSIFYAQQARSYALLHVGVAALLLLGTRLWETSRYPAGNRRTHRANEVGFVLVGLGLLYTHNLAIWTLAGAWMWVLPTMRGRLRSAALPVGLLVLGAMPWVATTLAQLGLHSELNAWMAGWWKSHSLALGPLYSIGVFSNGTASWLRPPSPLPALDPDAALLAYGIWTFVGIAFVLVSMRTLAFLWPGLDGPQRRSTSPHEEGRARRPRASTPPLPALAGLWLLLGMPLLGLIATTLLVGPAYVVGRTDTLALVPFVALLGVGWALRPRPWGSIGIGLWVLIGLWISFRPAQNPKGTDRALASWVGGQAGQGDVVVVSALGRPTLEHYAITGGWIDRLADIRAYPAELDRNPAAVYPTPLDSLISYEAQARHLRSTWEADSIPTVWILASLNPLPDAAHPSFPGVTSEPLPPPKARETITANDLLYPTSVLVYTLRGLEPVKVMREYRQDWVGGERVVLRISRSEFVPQDSLQAIQGGSRR